MNDSDDFYGQIPEPFAHIFTAGCQWPTAGFMTAAQLGGALKERDVLAQGRSTTGDLPWVTVAVHGLLLSLQGACR